MLVLHSEAIFLGWRPWDNKWRIWSFVSCGSPGRPPIRPLARAAASPLSTRSLIKDFSYSLITPRSWSWSRPNGESDAVLTPSLTLMKSTPCSLKMLMWAKRSCRLLPNLSSRYVKIRFTDPLLTIFTILSRTGRFCLDPLAVSWWNSTSSYPCLLQYSVRHCIWESCDWTSLETRTYAIVLNF